MGDDYSGGDYGGGDYDGHDHSYGGHLSASGAHESHHHSNTGEQDSHHHGTSGNHDSHHQETSGGNDHNITESISHRYIYPHHTSEPNKSDKCSTLNKSQDCPENKENEECENKSEGISVELDLNFDDDIEKRSTKNTNKPQEKRRRKVTISETPTEVKEFTPKMPPTDSFDNNKSKSKIKLNRPVGQEEALENQPPEMESGISILNMTSGERKKSSKCCYLC